MKKLICLFAILAAVACKPEDQTIFVIEEEPVAEIEQSYSAKSSNDWNGLAIDVYKETQSITINGILFSYSDTRDHDVDINYSGNIIKYHSVTYKSGARVFTLSFVGGFPVSLHVLQLDQTTISAYTGVNESNYKNPPVLTDELYDAGFSELLLYYDAENLFTTLIDQVRHDKNADMLFAPVGAEKCFIDRQSTEVIPQRDGTFDVIGRFKTGDILFSITWNVNPDLYAGIDASNIKRGINFENVIRIHTLEFDDYKDWKQMFELLDELFTSACNNEEPHFLGINPHVVPDVVPAGMWYDVIVGIRYGSGDFTYVWKINGQSYGRFADYTDTFTWRHGTPGTKHVITLEVTDNQTGQRSTFEHQITVQ